MAVPMIIVATHNMTPLNASPQDTPYTSDTQLIGKTPNGMKPCDIISMLITRPRIAWSTCSCTRLRFIDILIEETNPMKAIVRNANENVDESANHVTPIPHTALVPSTQ